MDHHSPSSIVVAMDLQSQHHHTTTNGIALMPLTQLILAFVAACTLAKVLLQAWYGKSARIAHDEITAGAADAVVGKPAPRPAWRLPIVGDVLSMAGYELPYQSFAALGRRHGPIIALQLGNQPAMVVNGIEHIKEVLIAKSAHFDSRPNFNRYHDLFSGNKENCKCLYDDCGAPASKMALDTRT